MMYVHGHTLFAIKVYTMCVHGHTYFDAPYTRLEVKMVWLITPYTHTGIAGEKSVVITDILHVYIYFSIAHFFKTSPNM